MKIRIGSAELEMGSEHLQELRDSSHLIDSARGLQDELEATRYLFIRGLHDREEMLQARLAVLDYIRGCGEEILDGRYKWQDGVLNARFRNFFEKLFGEPARTFDFKWLRAMYTEGFTGAHVDRVYMGRGTDRLYTIWTPFGDIPIEMGTLAVVEGSHKLPEFKKFHETYGNMDVEAENLRGTGWFTEDPNEITERFGGTWKTANFMAGDALVFTYKTVHMSTVNTTQYARISCDTRWQPASHEADPRYVGDIKQIEKPQFGVHAQTVKHERGQQENTIKQKKKEWGFD